MPGLGWVTANCFNQGSKQAMIDVVVMAGFYVVIFEIAMLVKSL